MHVNLVKDSGFQTKQARIGASGGKIDVVIFFPIAIDFERGVRNPYERLSRPEEAGLLLFAVVVLTGSRYQRRKGRRFPG